MLGFFFFQAEDGIRDYKVTGVKTCALPILVGAACALALWTAWPWLDEDVTNPLLFAAVGVTFVVTGILLRLEDRKSTRLNSSHLVISYAVFCLKKKKTSSRKGSEQDRSATV